MWTALVTDEARGDLIVQDLVACGRNDRSPLVLADRTAYLDTLERKFASLAPVIARYRLDGKVGKKTRQTILAAISRHQDEGTPFVLFATASLVGEGLDIPRLDTLFLTMPLSFRGRLVQYAGRLHRSHETKIEVIIYDYLDSRHPLTQAMFRRRASAYAQMGYVIEEDDGPHAAVPLSQTNSMFRF